MEKLFLVLWRTPSRTPASSPSCAVWPAVPCAGRTPSARRLLPAASARTRPRRHKSSDPANFILSAVRWPGYSQSNSMKNLLMVCCFAFLAAAPAAAQTERTERIRSFDSRITVNPDGSMLVQETIDVESAGIDIVHGIYRDFPTRNQIAPAIAIPCSLTSSGSIATATTSPITRRHLTTACGCTLAVQAIDLPDGPHTYEFEYRTNAS